VNEGDQVSNGTTIIIMESMKMELEIKSTATGKIHFLVPVNTAVTAQQPLAQIVGAGAPAAPPPPPVAAAAPAPQPVAAPAPSGGATILPAPVAGTVLRYAVREGTQVAAGTTVVVMESMKMELEIKSPAAGKVRFLVPANTAVTAQQPIAEIG
jgi:oxaloacetate decarboxylase alpha subunit